MVKSHSVNRGCRSLSFGAGEKKNDTFRVYNNGIWDFTHHFSLITAASLMLK